SFIFIGPTGVGKTELARALAEYLFDDQNALIRLDMSEYMEKHSVSRLIGAPPGYVGFEEGGQLTEAVRRRPYSVLLFDEIEKAHPDVFNTLLQLLDDGRLTDSQGRVVNFKNTIVIMTSNLGNVEGGENVQDALRSFFRPEFLNRIDEVVVFRRLDRQDVAKIADIQLEILKNRLAERRIELTVADEVRAWLAERGYDPLFGARPLKRLIQRSVQDGIALKILKGEIKDGQAIKVVLKAGVPAVL
ncbi:MAG: AAA family ATPase, partial [Candidatus Omnitrophica bacterium]|nr:AAA family ATPase [Candidatus Omnitrophota bacterium]